MLLISPGHPPHLPYTRRSVYPLFLSLPCTRVCVPSLYPFSYHGAQVSLSHQSKECHLHWAIISPFHIMVPSRSTVFFLFTIPGSLFLSIFSPCLLPREWCISNFLPTYHYYLISASLRNIFFRVQK